jgi:hypothetical protein
MYYYFLIFLFIFKNFINIHTQIFVCVDFYSFYKIDFNFIKSVKKVKTGEKVIHLDP